MTRPELRVLLDELFCGCGSPEAAAAALLRLLRLHPLHQSRDELKAWIPDDGIEHLVLYMLDSLELTEHGSVVGGGWLSPKGVNVRDALAVEEGNKFEALFAGHCVHGHDLDEPCVGCESGE